MASSAVSSPSSLSSLSPLPESVEARGGNSKKRRRTEDNEKESATAKLVKEINAAANTFKIKIGHINEVLDQMERSGCVVSQYRACLSAWLAATLEGTTANPKKSESIKKFLNRRLLEQEGVEEVDMVLRSYDEDYSEFAKLYFRHIESRPAPSSYAQPKIWHVEQKSGNLLCLRPPNKRGLPLSTLHKCFDDFERRVKSPQSNSPFTNAAIRAASSLCDSMGESFGSETGRQKKFDKCLVELFPTWASNYSLKNTSETTGGQADRVFVSDKGVPLVIREDKWEMSLGKGDAYVQLARTYELAVKALMDDETKINFVNNGAPMFLVGVLGTILFVAGGFYDGESMMVEPLEGICSMMWDSSGKRQEALALVLDALRQGTEELKSTFYTNIEPTSTEPTKSPLTFAFGTPRVYTVLNGNKLEFHKPFAPNDHGRLAFTAALTDSSAGADQKLSVLVKLVKGSYGGEVQIVLAKAGLAPIYHGSCAAGDAPIAHVMEFLNPATGWVTLYDFAKGAPVAMKNKESRDLIRRRIEDILEVLEASGLVHGDLRANNIMVKVDGAKCLLMNESDEVEMKVVDFDWAGTAGQVHYPAHRNERDIKWPGPAGGPIAAGDDRKNVDGWWKAFLL